MEQTIIGSKELQNFVEIFKIYRLSAMERGNLLSSKEVKFLLEKRFAEPVKRRSTKRFVRKEKVRQR